MDQNPNGEILETPDGSRPETITADEGSQVNPQGAQEPSAEEVAFNSLKGSTQDRIRTLANRANQANQLQSEMEQLKAEMEAFKLRSMTPTPLQNPDVQDAVSKLDQFGVATKKFVEDEIDKKVNQNLSGIVWKMEMDRLESRHSGQDGLPAFDRAEYEAYINVNPQYRGYTPEDVYNKMFEDDIFDAKVKGLGTQRSVKQGPTLRPTRTRVQEETMTPEYIEKRLAQPDGRQWYEQNIQKINAVINSTPSAE
jgi:hypothetical protein